MDFSFIKNFIDLLEEFDLKNTNAFYPSTVEGFKKWIFDEELRKKYQTEIVTEWEGKEKGRSAESAINTLLVQLNRYAKLYSKSAIADSEFSTQEDFIYLITLRSHGAMSKMDLIKKNIHEKPVGILIINRLLKQGWIQQVDSSEDKRVKLISITSKGINTLENQMTKIRQATQIVAGNLTYTEKMDLIRILNKLEKFHNPIYSKNIKPKDLIDTVHQEFLFDNKQS